LRESYKVVTTLKNTSGFTWDDTLGLNIGAQNAEPYEILEKVSSSSYQFTYANIHQANRKVKPFKTPLTLDFFSCETDVRNDRDRLPLLLASLRAECLHLPAELPAETVPGTEGETEIGPETGERSMVLVGGSTGDISSGGGWSSLSLPSLPTMEVTVTCDVATPQVCWDG
jgi:hypothetical protein